jgi:hypothetical protein
VGKVESGRNKEQAVSGARVWKARVEGAPPKTRRPAALSLTIWRAYERFLGLSVLVVLAVLWVAGAAILGLSSLILYLAGSELLRLVEAI